MTSKYPPSPSSSSPENPEGQGSNSPGPSVAPARPQIQVTTVSTATATDPSTRSNDPNSRVHSPLILTTPGVSSLSPDPLNAISPTLANSSHSDNDSFKYPATIDATTISQDHALYLTSSSSTGQPICFTTMPPGLDSKVVNLRKSRCPYCCALHEYMSMLLSITSEEDDVFEPCEPCLHKRKERRAVFWAARRALDQKRREQEEAPKDEQVAKTSEKYDSLCEEAGSASGEEVDLMPKQPQALQRANSHNANNNPVPNPRCDTLECFLIPNETLVGPHLAHHLSDPKPPLIASVPTIKISTRSPENSLAKATEELQSPLSPPSLSPDMSPTATDHSDDEPPRGRTLAIRGSGDRSLDLDMRHRLREISRQVLGPNLPATRPCPEEEVEDDNHRLDAKEAVALAKFLMLPAEDRTPSPPPDPSPTVAASSSPSQTQPHGADAGITLAEEPVPGSHAAGSDPPPPPSRRATSSASALTAPPRRTTVVTFAPDPKYEGFSLKRTPTARPAKEGGTTPERVDPREPNPGQALRPHTRAPSLDQVLVAGSSRRASLLQYVLTMDAYASEWGEGKDGDREGDGDGTDGGGVEEDDGEKSADAGSDWAKRFLGHRDTLARLEVPGRRDAEGVEEAREEREGQGGGAGVDEEVKNVEKEAKDDKA